MIVAPGAARHGTTRHDPDVLVAGAGATGPAAVGSGAVTTTSPASAGRTASAGPTDGAPDIKPRSRDVTDGLERAAARGMLRAVGMGDDDFAKPQIGVASQLERDHAVQPVAATGSRSAAKEGVHAAGGYPLEFGTISVSDGISMGHEGMHYSLVSAARSSPTRSRRSCRPSASTARCCWPAATSRCPAC